MQIHRTFNCAVYFLAMNNVPKLRLNTGAEMPVIGLGTWNLAGEAEAVALMALKCGYRHFDTAKIYGTEREIGQALKQANMPREDLFITTKLWNSDQGYDRALLAIDESLEQLGLEYVDLYLIHWPYVGGADGANKRKDTWRAMEDIYAAGKAKAIGVSNYEIKHLAEMETYAKVSPAVNQIEVHPFWYRRDLIEYCHEHGIVVTNYSPLVRKHHMNDPVIAGVAKAHRKSHAQVLLRWGLQLGNVVIPKSSQTEHLRENINVFDFELTQNEMQQLAALNTNESVV
jgi:diketogulonate reductase-like aldo/keto reductase